MDDRQPRYEPRPPHDGDPRWDQQYLGGIVRQVPIVAVLLIVQGVLEVLLGLVSLVGQLLSMGVQQPTPQGLPPQLQRLVEMQNTPEIRAVGLVFIVLVLACGGLKIFAGVQNRGFRGRVLGIVALFSGLGAACTCWCLPTAFALMVYGLIVYLNGDVARAFELADQGYTVDQITDLSR